MVLRSSSQCVGQTRVAAGGVESESACFEHGHVCRQRPRGPGQQAGTLPRVWTPFPRGGRGAHVPAASSVPSSHPRLGGHALRTGRVQGVRADAAAWRSRLRSRGGESGISNVNAPRSPVACPHKSGKGAVCPGAVVKIWKTPRLRRAPGQAHLGRHPGIRFYWPGLWERTGVFPLGDPLPSLESSDTGPGQGTGPSSSHEWG